MGKLKGRSKEKPEKLSKEKRKRPVHMTKKINYYKFDYYDVNSLNQWIEDDISNESQFSDYLLYRTMTTLMEMSLNLDAYEATLSDWEIDDLWMKLHDKLYLEYMKRNEIK